MTEISIDAERALELLRNRIRGNEDFVYPYARETCVYVMNDCPSCLIGQVLANAGVNVKDLKAMDSVSADTDIQSLYETKVLPENLIISEEAVDIFRIAQTAQDQGQTWGQVLIAVEDWWQSVCDE